MIRTLRQYLEQSALSKEAKEQFLHPETVVGTKFDPELAYVPSDVIKRNGIERCLCIYSYEPGGARRIINYRNHPCRINTYGDSFTHCDQVSDAETWQEVLAGHFGEPLRNFGVGGYGVYQAYRRMRRVESGCEAAPYVILNIYDNDHYRNLMSCRWIHIPLFNAANRQKPFHAMPWVHVRLDAANGKWIEKDNLFKTPESLCKLCDPQFVYETFRNDPVVKLEVLCQGGTLDDADAELYKLAEYFGTKLDLSSEEESKRTGVELYTVYALHSTMFTVDLVRQFTESKDQELMILLSYGSGNVTKALQGYPRFDQSLLDYLKKNNILFVDTLSSHVEDFKAFRLSPKDYCKRYYIGHYNPFGNHFFAWATKNALLEWLEPKPPTYAAEASL